jgi:hypothetical protein
LRSDNIIKFTLLLQRIRIQLPNLIFVIYEVNFFIVYWSCSFFCQYHDITATLYVGLLAEIMARGFLFECIPVHVIWFIFMCRNLMHIALVHYLKIKVCRFLILLYYCVFAEAFWCGDRELKEGDRIIRKLYSLGKVEL